MAILLDQRKNFVKGNISPINASATTVVLTTGASLFPAVTDGYNAVIWNSTDYSSAEEDPAVEIVRVTAFTTPNLTVIRAQEGTAAVTHNAVGKTYTIGMSLTAKMFDDIASLAAAAAGGVSFSINQIAHGFVVGNVIRLNTTQWTKALAVKTSSSDLSSEAWGVVTVVTDADNFTAQPLDGSRITIAGVLTQLAGYAGGDPVFLSDSTAGAVTNVEPTATNSVSKPIGYVEKDAGGTIVAFCTANYRGLMEGDSSKALGVLQGTVDVSVGGTETFTHNLGQIPTYIRLRGVGVWSGGSGGDSISEGYAVVNGAGVVTSQKAITSSINAFLRNDISSTHIFGLTANGNYFDVGQVSNVTATTFDLTITSTIFHGGLPKYLWEVSSY